MKHLDTFNHQNPLEASRNPQETMAEDYAPLLSRHTSTALLALEVGRVEDFVLAMVQSE
jgi:hypothetical protein